MGRAVSQSTVNAILDRMDAGEVSREEGVAALGNIEDYSRAKFHGYDGYEPGSADALVEGWMADRLTKDEVQSILLRWDEREVDG